MCCQVLTELSRSLFSSCNLTRNHKNISEINGTNSYFSRRIVGVYGEGDEIEGYKEQ